MTAPLIAIVDDDAAILALMQEILESEAGYRVITFQGATEIPAAIRAAQPALVILDLRIGRSAGGLEIIAQLRADPDTATIPVLLCTADGAQLREHTDRLAAEGIGALAKPFDLEDLLQAVAHALDAAPIR